MNIGAQIKRAREYRGLSQRQLAKLLGNHQADISNWETGKYVPQTISILRLSQTLKIRVEYFYTDNPPESYSDFSL